MHKVARGYIVSPPNLLPSSVQQEGVSWLSPGRIPVSALYTQLPRLLSVMPSRGGKGWGGTSHNQPLVLKVLLSFSTSAGLSGARGARQGPP